MNCVLCGNFENLNFNLKSSFTLHSNDTLINFVENVLDEIINSHCNVCYECYTLINELDSIGIREKEIKSRFRRYIEENGQTRSKSECGIASVSKIKKESNTQTYPCIICSINFPNEHRLNCHIQSEHSKIIPDLVLLNKSVEISGCGVKVEAEMMDQSKVITQRQLIVDTDLNEKPHAIKTELLESIEIEIRKNPKESNGNECDSTDTKRRGRKKKHPDVPKPHKCNGCTKEFRTLSELKSHTSSHNNHRPYVCEICGQAYKHQSAFTIHMGMHNGIHPFTCIYCKKSFTQKVALVRHVPIHTGEKPYQCHLCGKRFVHRTSFNMHQLSHTGEKSHKCTICGLALASGSHLKRHLRIHTGEKNHSCATCGRRFTERYNLVAHEKLHNSSSNVAQKRKYRCQICGNYYERKIKLEDHLVHDHQKINPESKPSETKLQDLYLTFSN